MQPDPDLSGAAERALVALRRRGVLASSELQALLGRSQPTVSRLMESLASQVVALGAGRSTRYAAPRAILGLPAQQPLAWVHEDGSIDDDWGTLTFIEGEQVHVRARGIDLLVRGGLPWFMAPLRPSGFLGRLLARRLMLHGADPNPERWSVAQVLFAALQTHDAPGALRLGEPVDAPAPVADADFDTLADDVAASLPAGSSAGGEQAKFLARVEERHVLVKFSPPRGTPFGERWHDLLHAEHLAHDVLRAHGVPVAATRVVETQRRTCLESTRSDRVGAQGRRHVVPLDAAHDAFVPGARQYWGATCEALARQRRLPPDAPAQARALQQFGRLIGNSDMHFGNLSLFVQPAEVPRGRFTLAPVYDMLPMRWRPDPQSGGLDLLAFEPAAPDLASAAQPIALEFWQRVADHEPAGRSFRRLAGEMARFLSASG